MGRRSEALQFNGQEGGGEGGLIILPALLPLLLPTGLPHHCFLLAKPNCKSEDRDTWMMQSLEVSLVRGKWRWASMCSERWNYLTKSLLLKFKPWSSRIPSITSIIYIIKNSSWKLEGRIDKEIKFQFIDQSYPKYRPKNTKLLLLKSLTEVLFCTPPPPANWSSKSVLAYWRLWGN